MFSTYNNRVIFFYNFIYCKGNVKKQSTFSLQKALSLFYQVCYNNYGDNYGIQNNNKK